VVTKDARGKVHETKTSHTERCLVGRCRGRSRRPRERHAAFSPPDRPEPIGLLEEQAASRVPELVPIRWGG